MRERSATDIQFRLANNLRRSLRGAVRNGHKGASAVKVLGCSLRQFKGWLERQFEPGMSWGNYGTRDGWHMDHIAPLSKFDLTDPEQVAMAFHYSNMRPLWASANIKKGNSTKELFDYWFEAAS